MQGELERILQALSSSGARYLVVGGVAVVLHGHPRFTADLDLVVGLEQRNLERTLLVLESLGYRPRAPVELMDFANAELRREWIETKGLTVLSLWSASFPATEVDIFAQEPFDFDAVWSRAEHVDLGFGDVTVVGLDDLLLLKTASGRPKDLEDVAALRELMRGGS